MLLADCLFWIYLFICFNTGVFTSVHFWEKREVLTRGMIFPFDVLDTLATLEFNTQSGWYHHYVAFSSSG
jgi:hypothetical protein